ncbi:MAG: CDP-glycerol glycerophosphotransferase family protein [Pseudomonadota bacterium]
MRPLQRAILQRGDTCAWFVFDPADRGHLREDETLLTTVEEMRAFNPRAVFVPGNWVPRSIPGVKVEVFHGFGFEKKGHFRVRGEFDLYCTPGPTATQAMQRQADKMGFFHVAQTGWPKIDALFAAADESDRSEGKSVVLYAPTFSESLTSAPALFAAIRDEIKTGRYRWICKFHPKMDRDLVARYRTLEADGLVIADEPDIVPSLHEADLMLTDTSSVVSEFLLLDKPVVTLRNAAPGPHIHNIERPEELAQALSFAVGRPAKLMDAGREFVNNVHPYRDSLSSDRVLDAVEEFIAHHRAGLKDKPGNWWRRAQIRRRLKRVGAL